MVATYARNNSILVRGTSVVSSCCISRRTTSPRTNASSTTLAGSGTRMSVEEMLNCDAAMKMKMIYNMYRYRTLRLLRKRAFLLMPSGTKKMKFGPASQILDTPRGTKSAKPYTEV